MLPLTTPGWLTLALTNLQKVALCPQPFPANMQMLYPEAPAGGGETKVTFTEGVAVCTGPGLPLKSTPPVWLDQL